VSKDLVFIFQLNEGGRADGDLCDIDVTLLNFMKNLYLDLVWANLVFPLFLHRQLVRFLDLGSVRLRLCSVTPARFIWSQVLLVLA
jgi:hypothetical protein